MESGLNRQQNILILSASHPSRSAGIVAYDLLQGLKNDTKGKVKLLVKDWDNYDDKDIITIENNLEQNIKYAARLIFRIYRKLMRSLFIGFQTPKEKRRSKFNSDYIFEDEMDKTFYPTKKILSRINFVPDVVIVLFMPRFISFKNLYEINQLTSAKIFLYMMDMAAMTGGCHYAWNCVGYTMSCGNCPAIYSSADVDKSRVIFDFKKKWIEDTDLTIIAGTEHQYRQLMKSSLYLKNEKLKILLGIDDEIFKPGNVKNARERLNLPIDKKIILCGAVTVAEKRKGFKEFVESLNILKQNEPGLNIHISIAGNTNGSDFTKIPYKYSVLGRLNYHDLALAFQAADVFVSPSIEDSGPMMINQSIMCGTPVVSFQMGVTLDLVITGTTGYCAKLGAVDDLEKGIKYVLKQDEKDQRIMSLNCRKIARELSSTKTQTKKMLESFKSI